MADRSVHYEAAFEAYLRDRAIPYVAVDEAKKALFANAKLKSFDFVVYSKTGPNLLIDVKGRQFPQRRGGDDQAVVRKLEDRARRRGSHAVGTGVRRRFQGDPDVHLLDRRAAD